MADRELDLILEGRPTPGAAGEACDEAVVAWRLWLAADQLWHEEAERWRLAEPDLLAASRDGGLEGQLRYQQGADRCERAARTAWSTLSRVLTSRPRTTVGAVAMLRTMRSLGEDQLQHPDLGTALSSVILFLEQARVV